MLDWNAITAIATVASAVIVAATVVLGARQIAHAREQLTQLRKATQLDGTLTIFNELATKEHAACLRYVMHELDAAMTDEAYRNEAGDPWSPRAHPEIEYLRRMERLAVIVNYGLLESEPLLDMLTPTYLHAWEKLVDSGVIAEQRCRRGPHQWRNAERLYLASRAFYERAAGGDNPAQR